MQRSHFLWRKSENLQTRILDRNDQTPNQSRSERPKNCVDRPKRDPKQAILPSLPTNFINHKVEFLVDSSAERSVTPRNLVPNALLYPCGVTLTGVGGNEIQTYGQCHVSIGIKDLRRWWKNHNQKNHQCFLLLTLFLFKVKGKLEKR